MGARRHDDFVALFFAQAIFAKHAALVLGAFAARRAAAVVGALLGDQFVGREIGEIVERLDTGLAEDDEHRFGEMRDVGIDELAGIEGFDEELAQELQSRAAEGLERREEASRAQRRELGVEDALADIPHLTEAMLVILGKAGIKTLDDLADLATDELIAKKRTDNRRGPARSERAEDKGGVLGEYGLSEEQGNEIIMAARAHWFDDEESSEPATGEAADADPAQ